MTSSKEAPDKSVLSTLNQKLCVGCGACINVCPRAALHFTCDKYGFYHPKCDSSKCNNCGLCSQTCPVLHAPQNKNILAPDCYAVIANNSDLRHASASGGAFSLLANQAFSLKGCVAGVAWKDDFTAEHILIENEADLAKIRKSKYLQSFTGTIFSSLKERLNHGQFCLFSGCPCQVAGLRAFLGREHDNLLLVDILCSYAPSQMFFRKYIESEFGDNILKYEFRRKLEGRKHDCSVVAIQTSKGEIIRIGRAQDSWQRLIHDYIMCPPHCEACSFCGLPRYGDFSLGDFWGVDGRDKSIDASAGVSVVLCNSEKARHYFEALPESEFRLRKKVKLAWVGPNGNVLPGKNRPAPLARDVFFDCITKMPFAEAAGYALNANHASYNHIWSQTNTPLQYGAELLHWRYDPVFWEEHLINGFPVLLVKPGQWQLGRFARLPLARPLLRNRSYTVKIKFRIKTARDSFNFHFSSSNTDHKHVFYTFQLDPEARDGRRINTLKLEFEPKSDTYDEFMIAASQLNGPDNFICFHYILIEENEL